MRTHSRLGFIFFVFISLLLISITYAQEENYRYFTDVQQLQAYLRWSPERVPLIGAHRGGPMPGYPENSLAAFENSLKYTPSLIETDVRKSKDGYLVIMHDETLDRTTTGTGRVSDYTLAELRKLRLKDPSGQITDYRIPTLGEVLEWARGRTIVQLDIKKPVTPEEIVQAIQRHQAFSYTIVITYNRESALRYHQLNPELVLSVSATGIEGTRRLLDTELPPRNMIAFVGVSQPSPQVYEMLHARGIRAILGTMGNLDRSAEKRGVKVYINLLENGADVLATDNIQLAAEAIRLYMKQKNAVE